MRPHILLCIVRAQLRALFLFFILVPLTNLTHSYTIPPPMQELRNIAIIAHVDHGKTTLVDALLRQSDTHLKAEVAGQSQILDSNEIERERGITIFSKNASVVWKGTKINIIDTPGHADFGGEVERVLTMADGALLLVDAKEGPMPQTRFVLKKALQLGLPIIVVINKIDKPDARPDFALDETFTLFIELGASDAQADFLVVYASGKQGKAGFTPELDSMKDIAPVFEAILKHIPAPKVNVKGPLQFLAVSLSGDPFKGRMATGKIHQGTIRQNDTVVQVKWDGTMQKVRIVSLMTFEGLERVDVAEATAGDIVAISGIEDIMIGETITDPEKPMPLPMLAIDEPTIKMAFSTNTSPFAGREGEYSTSRKLRERLYKELETDVALRVTDGETPDIFLVSGRGELHISILIERMRREGYEFQVSQPEVIYKEKEGKQFEPFEQVFVEVPDQFAGTVIEKMGKRTAEMKDMHQLDGVSRFVFLVATSRLFGYRSEFLTDTKGLGIMSTLFFDYLPATGKKIGTPHGSLVAFETGITTHYALESAQERGNLFVGPGTEVYKGMVVGQNSRDEDLEINVCKKKALSNMRSKGEGVAVALDAPRTIDVEDAIEYVGENELVEITPKNVRIRKKILDKSKERLRLKLASS